MSLFIPRIGASMLAACIALVPMAATATQDANKKMQDSMATSQKGGASMAMGMGPSRADSQAPLGVMGADTMPKGMWMLSYQYSRMEMKDTLRGTDHLTPEQIATSVPNRFFGIPGQPATLRVVPKEMTMEMHMFSAMYAPTERLTLMGMLPYMKVSMDHITFQGMAGTTRLGEFTTESSGIGDLKLMGLYRVWKSGDNQLHLNAGLSLPTGSIDEEDEVFTPMGARPTQRLPYPMQLGSGTFDLMPGITYKGRSDNIGWGAQYLATLRLSDNDEGYTFGDTHQITGWGSYSWTPAVSASLRVTGRTTGKVDGIDPLIVAPSQAADPNYQGGDRVDIGIGLNFAGQQGALRGVRAAIEFGLPAYQDLNGPQLEADWTLSAGVKMMF